MEIRLIPTNQRPGQQPPADITIRLFKKGDAYECHGSSALLVYANANVEIQEANGRFTVTFPAKQQMALVRMNATVPLNLPM